MQTCRERKCARKCFQVPSAAKPGGEEKKADAKGAAAAPYKSCIWKFGICIWVCIAPELFRSIAFPVFVAVEVRSVKQTPELQKEVCGQVSECSVL